MKEKEALLSTSPWVDRQSLEAEKLSDEDLALIEKIGIKKYYSKGASILSMGSQGEVMYFIQKGIIRYSMLSRDGIEKPVLYLKTGCFLGEEAIFHRYPTICVAIAVEEVEAIAIENRYIQELISRPTVAYVLLKSISLKSRVLAFQVEDLVFRSTIEKVCRLLYCFLAENLEEKNKYNEKGITQHELAAIAGAHRVSISNAIAQLKKEGIIKTKKDGSIIVEDWEKLEEKGFGAG